MSRWSSHQLQVLGYVLGTAAALLITVVAFSRPGIGPAPLGVAVLLVLTAGAMIWLGQKRGGTR